MKYKWFQGFFPHTSVKTKKSSSLLKCILTPAFFTLGTYCDINPLPHNAAF